MYLYKSITGSVVNIGPYVISAHTGIDSLDKIPELDAEVGNLLSVEEIGVVEFVKEVVTEEVAKVEKAVTEEVTKVVANLKKFIKKE